jgi:hypothetical protein
MVYYLFGCQKFYMLFNLAALGVADPIILKMEKYSD